MYIDADASPLRKDAHQASALQIVKDEEGGYEAYADAAQHGFMNDAARVRSDGASDCDVGLLGPVE